MPITSILVIEDDPAHAELVRRAFEDHTDRFEVRVFEDYDTGTANGLARTPDLVISDWRLPGGSGIDVIEFFEGRDVPVVLMTGQGDEKIAVDAMKAGALDYVIKSDSMFAELPTTVERLVREWGHLKRSREAEQALTDSEARFRTLIDGSSDMIFIVSLEHVVEFANASVTRLLGVDKKDVVGERVATLFGSEAPKVVNALNGAMRGRRGIAAFSVRLTTDQSHVRTFDCTGVVHQLPEGRRFVLNCRDTTERSRLQDEKLAYERDFSQSQRLDAIGRLAGGIAHDFNNLLTVIGGHAELLQGEQPGTETWKDCLKEILRAQTSATSLTRQLLAFSRQQPISPSQIQLNKVVREMTGMLDRLIGPSVSVELDLGSNLPDVEVDPGQMEQVLLNLLVNARDAMPDGGKVRVQTDLFLVDEVEHGGGAVLYPGDYVRLRVIDQGTGMEPEVAARVFEPFFFDKEQGQGHRSRPGYGLRNR